MMKSSILTAMVFVLSASSARAQAVTGRWLATFDGDISTSQDTFVVKSRLPAVLELMQHGDSVSGKWTVAGFESIDVRGTFDGRTLKLTTGLRDREVRINGQPVKRKTRTDWSATVDGGKLAGTMFIRMGDREPPPRRWDAHR